MSSQTFEKEITVGETLIWLKKLEKCTNNATKLVMVKQLLTRQLSLISTTVLECIPKKPKLSYEELGTLKGSEKLGKIQAIDEFTTNLREKGVIE